MGRYYDGDIEGKFWFAVQSSNDASFFGGSQSEPNYIEYYFSREDDMDSIAEGIAKCEAKLGEDEKKIEEFFKDKQGYNDDMFLKELGWNGDKVKERLEWYARLTLGRKIHEQVKKTGYCEFRAEL
jgi:hypothetical protein